MNAVTLLHAQAPRPLAKTWKADGKIDRYPNLKTFSCSSRPVGSIRELSTLLAELEGAPSAARVKLKSCVWRAEGRVAYPAD